MTLSFKITAWLRYNLLAHYRMGYHVHSPYTYTLFTNVLFERWSYYSFERIENFRRKMSSRLNLCRSDQPKYAQLLQRLCATNNPKTILQLGTGSGITAMYLASNDSHSTVYSCSSINEEAVDVISNFKLLRYNNIKLSTHDVASRLMKELNSVDFLYVRPSQGYKNIREWFDKCLPLHTDTSIFVFDDIHTEPEIERQWNSICQSPSVTLSLDLYRLGVVWFRCELKKQHYIVKY